MDETFDNDDVTVRVDDSVRFHVFLWRMRRQIMGLRHRVSVQFRFISVALCSFACIICFYWLYLLHPSTANPFHPSEYIQNFNACANHFIEDGTILKIDLVEHSHFREMMTDFFHLIRDDTEMPIETRYKWNEPRLDEIPSEILTHCNLTFPYKPTANDEFQSQIYYSGLRIIRSGLGVLGGMIRHIPNFFTVNVRAQLGRALEDDLLAFMAPYRTYEVATDRALLELLQRTRQSNNVKVVPLTLPVTAANMFGPFYLYLLHEWVVGWDGYVGNGLPTVMEKSSPPFTSNKFHSSSFSNSTQSCDAMDNFNAFSAACGYKEQKFKDNYSIAAAMIINNGTFEKSKNEINLNKTSTSLPLPLFMRAREGFSVSLASASGAVLLRQGFSSYRALLQAPDSVRATVETDWKLHRLLWMFSALGLVFLAGFVLSVGWSMTFTETYKLITFLRRAARSGVSRGLLSTQVERHALKGLGAYSATEFIQGFGPIFILVSIYSLGIWGFGTATGLPNCTFGVLMHATIIHFHSLAIVRHDSSKWVLPRAFFCLLVLETEYISTFPRAYPALVVWGVTFALGSLMLTVAFFYETPTDASSRPNLFVLLRTRVAPNFDAPMPPSPPRMTPHPNYPPSARPSSANLPGYFSFDNAPPGSDSYGSNINLSSQERPSPLLQGNGRGSFLLRQDSVPSNFGMPPGDGGDMSRRLLVHNSTVESLSVPLIPPLNSSEPLTPANDPSPVSFSINSADFIPALQVRSFPFSSESASSPRDPLYFPVSPPLRLSRPTSLTSPLSDAPSSPPEHDSQLPLFSSHVASSPAVFPILPGRASYHPLHSDVVHDDGNDASYYGGSPPPSVTSISTHPSPPAATAASTTSHQNIFLLSPPLSSQAPPSQQASIALSSSTASLSSGVSDSSSSAREPHISASSSLTQYRQSTSLGNLTAAELAELVKKISSSQTSWVTEDLMKIGNLRRLVAGLDPQLRELLIKDVTARLGSASNSGECREAALCLLHELLSGHVYISARQYLEGTGRVRRVGPVLRVPQRLMTVVRSRMQQTPLIVDLLEDAIDAGNHDARFLLETLAM